MLLLSTSQLIRQVLRNPSRCRLVVASESRTWFSSASVPNTVGTPAPQLTPKPPSQVTEEMVVGIQDATHMYMKYGLGKQRLLEIAKDSSSSTTTLVVRWQRMMEAFLGTQVHVLAGLGYSPDERGLATYNRDVALCVQGAAPESQEEIRIKGRDTWRHVLQTAFDLKLEQEIVELPIVEARNIMHKVSVRMQDTDILKSVARRADMIKPSNNEQIDMAMKHQVVQEVLVEEVYLGGDPSLVKECGFGDGEQGYVYMQCVLAEHQNDPLVSQYIGTAMMKILTAAGLDMQAMQQAQQAVSDAAAGSSKETSS